MRKTSKLGLGESKLAEVDAHLLAEPIWVCAIDCHPSIY